MQVLKNISRVEIEADRLTKRKRRAPYDYGAGATPNAEIGGMSADSVGRSW